MQVPALGQKPKMPLLIAITLYFMLFFCFTFPKAGIKIADIPVTVSDILFLLLILFSLTRITCWRETFFHNKTVIILMMIFACYATLKLGYSYWHYDLLNIGVIVPLLVYPVIFLILLLFDRLYSIPWEKMLLIPVIAFIILSVYALLQYFLGIETVMIPGLTYNWTDAQNPLILVEKKNYYGPYTKIFSTYQNGNIFGVNLLLLFPLVFELLYDRRKSLGYIALGFFITVAFHTASRAVWAAVLCYVLIRFLLFKQGLKKLTVIFPLSFITALLLFVEQLRSRVSNLLGKDSIPRIIKVSYTENFAKHAPVPDTIDWWVDQPQIKNLSGREEGIFKLWEATFGTLNWGAIFLGPYGILPRSSYSIVGEMLYAAVFAYLGLIGLILWSLPVLFSLYNFYKLRGDYIVRGILLGLVGYFIAAVMEGAYWVSPTAFNLWLIIGIGWIRWHSIKGKMKLDSTASTFER
ncbi:MAG TPA: hypothetical protein PKN87_05295 [Syntrophomonadaceae bacterium]|nr:hypothetical protein [Syntrophomonadaceae bacterium]HPR93321.1 hypothetical protein [Syntrophomonadaceae bacterium]